MNVKITLTDGQIIKVDSFERLTYASQGGEKTFQSLDHLNLNDSTTYRFFGKPNVIIQGKEIRYITQE